MYKSTKFFVRDYPQVYLAWKAAVDLSKTIGAGTIYIIHSPSGNVTGFELRVYEVR